MNLNEIIAHYWGSPQEGQYSTYSTDFYLHPANIVNVKSGDSLVQSFDLFTRKSNTRESVVHATLSRRADAKPYESAALQKIHFWLQRIFLSLYEHFLNVLAIRLANIYKHFHKTTCQRKKLPHNCIFTSHDHILWAQTPFFWHIVRFNTIINRPL